MNDSNYSPSLVSALKIARGMALQDKHNTFGVSHLVMAMFAENTGLKEILSSMQKDVGYIMEWFDTHREMYRSSGTSTEEVEPDEELSKVLDESERSKIKLGADSIDSICVFTAILREGVVYSHQQIEMLDISENDILSHYNALTPLYSYQGEEMQITASVPYADNLKNQETINAGGFVVGREKEVRTILECLERSENKGILIVGESGIGKSSIINAFVKDICENEDEMLKQISIVGLNTAKLLASTSSETEIAQKVVNLMHKLNQLEQAVLVIDDLQVLLENSASGKASTLVNILSAQISEGAANLVLTLTNDSYRKNIEKHPIEGRLDIIKIEELDTTTLESAIQLHKKRIENYYELRISDACIKDSIALSKRYFKGSVMMKDKEGNSYTADGEGNITISASKSITLCVGENKIMIDSEGNILSNAEKDITESAGANIAQSAENIDCTASSNYNISSTDFTASGSSSATVSGTTKATIDSSGTTAVAGTIVKLN